MIEQNKHSPSVASLQKIAHALDVSAAEFFSTKGAFLPKSFYAAEDLTILEEGGVRFAVVAGERRQKNIQIMYETYEPGADTGVEMLAHEGEEGGIVLEGAIEVTTGDQTQTLGPGEAYYFASEVPHRFRNLSQSVVVLVSACTPPSL